MPEHPDVAAARQVLQAALDALAAAERAADPDDILMYDQAVKAAREQLGRLIRDTAG